MQVKQELIGRITNTMDRQGKGMVGSGDRQLAEPLKRVRAHIAEGALSYIFSF